MSRRLIITLSILSLAVLVIVNGIQISKQRPAPVQPNGKPAAHFESESIDLGTMRPGSIAKTSFKFTNVGSATLKISDLRASCECVQLDLNPREFKPGETGVVNVTHYAADRDMSRTFKIIINSNDAETPSRCLKLQATVQSLLQIDPTDVFFGMVTRGSEATRKVVLQSKDRSSFAIKSANVVPADFELEPFTDQPGETQTIVVKTKPAAPPRVVRGQLTIVVDRDKTPINLPISMIVREKINAVPRSIVIVENVRGKEFERTIIVEAAESVTFKITSAKTENGVFSCRTTELIPGKKCQINVTFSAPAGDKANLYSDCLIVATDCNDLPELRIPLSAVINDKSAVSP
jgi:hypothetical protein